MSTTKTATSTKRRTKAEPPVVIETVTCSICDKEIEKPAATEFDGKWLCPDCL